MDAMTRLEASEGQASSKEAAEQLSEVKQLTTEIMSSSGAVPFIGGSCFVAGARRRRRFVALGPRARICGRVHAVEDGPLAAR